MYTVDATLIRAELFKRQMTVKEFAKQIGINAFTLSRLLKDGAKTQAKIIGKLSNFFKIRGEDLILKKQQ